MRGLSFQRVGGPVSASLIGRDRRITVPPVADVPPVIIALLAGQSNMEGRNPIGDSAAPNDPNPELYHDQTGIFQFGGDTGGSYYRQLSADITPLEHPGQSRRIGPDLPILYQIKADNPAAVVIGVPLAVGSTAIVGGGWESNATAGAGGSLFERMVTHGNLARDAALTAYPGAAVSFRFYWVQGEQDASNNVSTAVYQAALADVIARSRSRISGAANAPWVLGSQVPRRWALPGDPANAVVYSDGAAAINRAHVALSVAQANVRYVRGPNLSNDNLHYQPQAAARTLGFDMANTANDAVGPNVTTAAAASNFSDKKLSVTLTHDDPSLHATFAIVGGANAGQFELSDAYISPKLRWTGDTNGPAAGDYVVQVAARDGAGNVGPAKTITISQVVPAVEALAVAAGASNASTITGAFGTFTAPAFDLKKGGNVIYFTAGTGGYKSNMALTVGGNAVTKIFDAGTAPQYAFYLDSATDQTVDLVFTHSGSASANIRLGSFVMKGANPVPVTTAFQPTGNVQTPWDSTALAVAADQVMVSVLINNAAVAAVVAPATLVALQGINGNQQAVAKRTDVGTSAIRFTGTSGTSRSMFSFVFAKASG